MTHRDGKHLDDKHLDDKALTLAYFQEGPQADLQHLRICSACRAEFARLSTFLDSLRSVPAPERPPEWENRLWAEIAPGVIPVLERGRLRVRYWLWTPLAASLLAIAFLAGLLTQRHINPPGQFSSHARERVLLIALGDYLDRSQIVLAEIENAPQGKPLNITAERRIAGNLIGANRLLRQTATRDGDIADAMMLDQLERVLMDVAHAPSQVSSSELDEIRRRIEGQGLLFKVRVVSANAREKGMKL